MSKSPPSPPLLERQGLVNMAQSGNHNETHKGQTLYSERQYSVKDEAGVSCYCRQISRKERKQPCVGASIRSLFSSCSVALSRKPAGSCWRWKSGEMGHEDVHFDLKRQLRAAGFSSISSIRNKSAHPNKWANHEKELLSKMADRPAANSPASLCDPLSWGWLIEVITLVERLLTWLIQEWF